MSECKTFHGVTPAIFECVKASSAKEHGTTYDPPTGTKGTATTKTVIGPVVVSFDLDTGTEAIQYCIVSKPIIVSPSEIFNGIAETINGCRSKQ